MRALLLALLLLAPPALAQEGRLIERSGWTQFLPDWHMGPANFTFRGTSVNATAWVAFATDGETWLYGSNESTDALQTPREGCAPADNITAVVITTYACSFAKHPSIVCSGVGLCDEATGSGPTIVTVTPNGGGTRPPTTAPIVTQRQPTPGAYEPDCRMLQGARCTTQGPAVLFATLALGGAAMLARRRR